MPNFHVSTESAATPEVVWQLAVDLPRYPEWNVRHDSFVGDVPATLAEGTTYRERVKMMGVSTEVTWRVVTAEAPRRLDQTSAGYMGIKAHNRLIIEPSGTGSRITLEMEFNGPVLGGPIAAVMEKQVGATAKESLAKFVVLLAPASTEGSGPCELSGEPGPRKEADVSWGPLDREVSDRRDLLAMHVLAPLSTTYVPWTISAMRPSGLVAVLNEITVNRRRCVVELGSGVSTHYIGRLLARLGGHVWSVEHDVRWADQIESDMAGEGLSEVVTIVRAPLTPVASPWADDATWYDQNTLSKVFAGRAVDLLVIDGPPAHEMGKEHSRYPALHFFANALADDYAIILDDIDRPGEQDIMDRWKEQFGIAFERRFLDGMIGIGRPQSAYAV